MRTKTATPKALEISPREFRDECIQVIATAIAQRRVLLKNGKSPFALNLAHRQVIAQYDAHRHTWTVRGVARFMLKHGYSVLQLIPWTNGPAVCRCKELIETSKKMLAYA